jgi:asparagine synthase (glutamine-hydrolysing)
MFAFGIWDESRSRLFLARDRMGIKPLYYTWGNGKFLFASEIKALLRHPDVEADIDPQALYHYLTFLTTPAPLTLFRGIHKLPPGHRAIVDADGHMTIEQWWDAIVPDNPQLTEGDCVDEIRSLLRDSVKLRMMSDVPFGVFLSGGVDSSTNVALMSELMDRPVDTFTVGFRRNAEFNELDHARRVAKEFKTNHHEVLIDEADLIELLPKLVHFQDEPIGDPVCVPLYYVAQLARESGTIVLQVGEGADELFCGYGSYMQFLRAYGREWRLLKAVPRPLLSLASGPVSAFLSRTGRGHYLDFFKRAVDGGELFMGGAIAYYESEKVGLVSPDLLGSSTSSAEIVKELYAKIDSAKTPDFLQRMTYLDLKLRLPELLLMRVDKMTMANSIEARVPFLDHRIVELASSLPSGLKTQGGVPKYILKKAVEGIIPTDIIQRRKMGFGVPVSAWLREDLGAVFDKVCEQTGLRDRGLLDFDAIDRMVAAHRAGSEGHAFQLWILLNLFVWYDHWIGDGAKL